MLHPEQTTPNILRVPDKPLVNRRHQGTQIERKYHFKVPNPDGDNCLFILGV